MLRLRLHLCQVTVVSLVLLWAALGKLRVRCSADERALHESPKETPPINPWNKFQWEHGGKGLSKQSMAKLYQYSKSNGSMPCRCQHWQLSCAVKPRHNTSETIGGNLRGTPLNLYLPQAFLPERKVKVGFVGSLETNRRCRGVVA